MTQPNVAVKHLFLLMGDNPLPNAVAALTLLEPEGTPYLVHTRKTQPAAERLEAVLREFPRLKPAQLIDLETYQVDSFQIRQRIQMRTESRVALVCCRWDGESLRSELEVETRDKKIAVFGRQDLPTLGEKIARWVEWNG